MKLIDAKKTREQLGVKEKITPKNLYISQNVFNDFKEACGDYTVTEVLINIERQAIETIKKPNFKMKPLGSTKRDDRKKKSYTCTDQHEQDVLEVSNLLGVKPYIFREAIMLQFIEQSA